MKKMFAVGATAALMLAASSPAFAQATAVQFDGDDTNAVFFNQVQNVSGITQSQFGDANASAVDDGEATAEASNEFDVTQQQVLNGFFGFYSSVQRY